MLRDFKEFNKGSANIKILSLKKDAFEFVW